MKTVHLEEGLHKELQQYVIDHDDVSTIKGLVNKFLTEKLKEVNL